VAIRERTLLVALKLALFAIFLLLLLFHAREAAGAQYVASATGDDANPGTSERPWRTLAHAAGVTGPGDVVSFRAGTYATTDEVVLTRSGTSGAPISFVAWPGETPVLDGGGEPGGIVRFDPGVSFVRLSGFTVRGFRVWGLFLAGGNRGVVLDHLDVSGGEACLRMTDGSSGDAALHGGVEDVLVEDGAFHDSTYTVIDCTPGPCDRTTFRRVEVRGGGLGTGISFGSDGIGLEKGREVVVEDCYVHDNGGDGIDLNSRDTAGNVAGVVVRRNRVVRNRLMGIKLWAGGRMENNAVWGQGITPVMLGRFPGTYVVVNNTVAYNMWDASFAERDYALVAGYPWDDGTEPAIALTLAGNVFAFNTGPAVGSPTGIYVGPRTTLVERNNLWFSREDGELQADVLTGRDPQLSRQEILDGTWAALSGQGAGDLGADPLFASGWPAVDLHLLAGSPAIDAADASLAPADDLEGRRRDARPDAGAYEGGSAASQPYVRVVPAVAHAPGSFGSLWRTDVDAVNLGASSTATLTFRAAGGGVETRTKTVPTGATRWTDVLASVFDVAADAKASGALEIASDRALVVSSRTFNAVAGGTFGAHLPGVTGTSAATPDRPGILPQLKKGAAVRTNVGLTNLGTEGVTVAIRLFAANGTGLGGEKLVAVPAGALVQLDDVFASCGTGDAAIAWGRIEVRTAGGRVFAYASVIDNATGDPTIVPVIVP
jgi:hypothetical protein